MSFFICGGFSWSTASCSCSEVHFVQHWAYMWFRSDISIYLHLSSVVNLGLYNFENTPHHIVRRNSQMYCRLNVDCNTDVTMAVQTSAGWNTTYAPVSTYHFTSHKTRLTNLIDIKFSWLHSKTKRLFCRKKLFYWKAPIKKKPEMDIEWSIWMGQQWM